MRDYPAELADPTASPEPRRLTLWDSICLIVGIIIGASIYETSPSIFASSGSAARGMAAWALGGAVSLIGALCYAELASCYRTAGGDYTYLTRAYGSKVGFIFAWAELAVIRTGGSIAFMAYVFARYATEFCPLGEHSKLVYALLGIIGLTFVNAIGVRPGRLVQNLLTTANIVGLSSVALIGLVWWLMPGQGQPAAAAAPANGAGPGEPVTLSFALTMVLVFYAYGGWNEAAFIASEVDDPKRNVRRALIIGTLLVTGIYLAVNLAYVAALGYGGMCKSEAIAADMFALPFGDSGRKAISAGHGQRPGVRPRPAFHGHAPVQHVRPGPPGVRLDGRQGRPAALARGAVRPGGVQHSPHRRGRAGATTGGRCSARRPECAGSTSTRRSTRTATFTNWSPARPRSSGCSSC